MKKYQKKGWIYAEEFDQPVHGGTPDAMGGVGISVSNVDYVEINGPGPWGMVATNPSNKSDRWYINHDYFLKHYEEAK